MEILDSLFKRLPSPQQKETKTMKIWFEICLDCVCKHENCIGNLQLEIFQMDKQKETKKYFDRIPKESKESKTMNFIEQ